MDSQFDKGLAMRKQVMGEDFVAKAFGAATDFTQGGFKFQVQQGR